MVEGKLKMAVQAALRMAIIWLCLAAPAAFANDIDNLKKAAEQGDVEAQYNLGVIFMNGNGVPQDYAQAVNWYQESAERGYAGAQFNLGAMYGQGLGVQQDYVQAYLWFNLAAAGTSQDTEVRKQAAAIRDQLGVEMTPTQITEAQRLAREWKPE